MTKTPESLKEFINTELRDISFYQEMTWNGEIVKNGLRDTERRKHINLSDIVGKNVLDVGCATGAECLWSIENGAKSAVGIDVESKIIAFNKITNFLNINNVCKGVFYNLDNGLPEDIKNTKFDTAFLFSITHNIKHKNIWLDIAADVIYFETGADMNYKEHHLSSDKYIAKHIAKTTGSKKVPRFCRDLFRLERK